MRILQITDIHINKLFELTNQVNVIENFSAILESGMEYRPDLVVLTGDLGHNDLQINVYQWIKEQLQSRGVPYRVIGGNHDDASMMADVFGDVQGTKLYFTYRVENFKFLFLNTIYGKVDDEQLEWLKEEIKEDITAIFMHYPPFLSGIPHMDTKYAMQQRTYFLDVLLGVNQRFRIFTGHYHTERVIEYENVSVYITPSTFVQISDKTLEFTPDHYKPAYRMLEWDDGTFKSWVRYLGM